MLSEAYDRGNQYKFYSEQSYINMNIQALRNNHGKEHKNFYAHPNKVHVNLCVAEYCQRHPQTVAVPIVPKPPFHLKFPVKSWSVIKPKTVTQKPQERISHLTPWGISLLPMDYIQFGFLLPKPPISMEPQSVIDLLKDSLSQTLTYFFPLSGRLETKVNDEQSCSIFVNSSSNSMGAELIHAIAKDVTIADIAFSDDPDLVESMFAFKGAINFDGHTIPLLVILVTQLADGIFIGCSINHSVADGTTAAHFIQTWSEITRMAMKGHDVHHVVSRPPIIKNWSMGKYGTSINIPFKYYNDIPMHAAPPSPKFLDGVVFQFSAESIARLTKQANIECCTSPPNAISSLQAFSAFLWRCITRARQLPMDQKIYCLMAASDRFNQQPRISQDQFGCYVQSLVASSTAGKLLSNNLGYAAWILRNVVISHSSANVRRLLDAWINSPIVPQLEKHSLFVEGSPRFRVYENDFGWGKPVAVRSGYGNKVDGTVFIYQASQGGGNLITEVYLPSQSMKALLADVEFMDFVSPSTN